MTPERELYNEVTELVRTKRLTEARNRLEAAIHTTPPAFWLLRLYADVLLKSGDTKKAEPFYAQLLAMKPGHPRVLSLAADRHRMEGRHAEATTLYLQILQKNEDPYVRTRAIDGLMRQKRFPEAERLIEEGLHRQPDNPYLLRRQARLLAATSRPKDAARIFSRLSNTSPSMHSDYVEAIRLQLDRVPTEDQLREIEHLISATSHRDNPLLHLLAAEICVRNGDDKTATAWLEKAASLAKNDHELIKRIGFQYNKIGAYGRVLDTLGQAFLESPRNLVSQQVLFAAARKSNRLPELRTLLKQAYTRHPNFHKLNGLLKKVDKEIQQKGTQLDPVNRLKKVNHRKPD